MPSVLFTEISVSFGPVSVNWLFIATSSVESGRISSLSTLTVFKHTLLEEADVTLLSPPTGCNVGFAVSSGEPSVNRLLPREAEKLSLSLERSLELRSLGVLSLDLLRRLIKKELFISVPQIGIVLILSLVDDRH